MQLGRAGKICWCNISQHPSFSRSPTHPDQQALFATGILFFFFSFQSLEWMILSHGNCFIQKEVIGLWVLLDSLHPRSTRAPRWSPPVFQGEAAKILLASVSLGIWAMEMFSNWDSCIRDFFNENAICRFTLH